MGVFDKPGMSDLTANVDFKLLMDAVSSTSNGLLPSHEVMRHSSTDGYTLFSVHDYSAATRSVLNNDGYPRTSRGTACKSASRAPEDH